MNKKSRSERRTLMHYNRLRSTKKLSTWFKRQFQDSSYSTEWFEHIPRTGMVVLVIVSKFRCDKFIPAPGESEQYQMPRSKFSSPGPTSDPFTMLADRKRTYSKGRIWVSMKQEFEPFSPLDKTHALGVLSSILRELCMDIILKRFVSNHPINVISRRFDNPDTAI